MDIEQLIETGGILLSKSFDGPGILGNNCYPECRLDEPWYSRLKEWYLNVIELLKEMGQDEYVKKIGRIPVTTNVVKKGILPKNIEEIRKVLIRIRESQ